MLRLFAGALVGIALGVAVMKLDPISTDLTRWTVIAHATAADLVCVNGICTIICERPGVLRRTQEIVCPYTRP